MFSLSERFEAPLFSFLCFGRCGKRQGSISHHSVLNHRRFQFPVFPPLWCSFLSEMETVCCVLTVLEINVIYYYLLTRLTKNLSVLGDGESLF